MLVLSLLQIDDPIKKSRGKSDIVGSNSLGHFKIIFTLLTKVITVHVRFSEVKIWGLKLKSFS